MNTVLSDEQIKMVCSYDNVKYIDDYERDIAKAQDSHTRSELARLVREMIIKDPHYKSQMEVNEALQAVLKVLEGTK